MQPTPVQLAYIAGFFDGEGYIGIILVRKANRHNVQVSIGQIDPRPLQLIHSLFGGCLRLYPSRGRQRAIYRWSASCKRAGVFLSAIEEFLINKREQCRIALSMQRLQTSRGLGGKRLSAEEWQSREENRAKVIALNRGMANAA